ncbi:DUF3786 domain-containing protein [Desulfallas sp. Bu1-1]|uniref:DUF3786 domain-containing protein n=1 Tax=Desulfallas sp. Bu1-1 TaxID=2787620 RepID=UPI00189F58E9|nr:DUF3786 domain-containing protein [Desulfallas sp. Bu1-1]MBF7083301.1 DUF3786 domain-containing protein [Desulfallas sp. Bu1-1]
MCNELTAHSAAVKDFLSTDPDEMALKSGACYSEDRLHIVINYFARKHFVSLSTGEVTTPGGKISFNDATLVLQYLKQCSGLPPRGKWISFLELPQGEHHYVPFLNDACKPISEAFGDNPALLEQRVKKLGGQKLDLGDFSALVPAFPKLPLAVVLWEGDEEFPAKATILFDSIAPHHLSTAALWVLGCELTKKLLTL